MKLEEIVAHATHCCKHHGCVDHSFDCPVVYQLVDQLYVCPECEKEKERPYSFKMEKEASSYLRLSKEPLLSIKQSYEQKIKYIDFALSEKE